MTVDVTAGSRRQRSLPHDIGRCGMDPERAIVASDRCDLAVRALAGLASRRELRWVAAGDAGRCTPTLTAIGGRWASVEWHPAVVDHDRQRG
jgi:hypothetical protein